MTTLSKSDSHTHANKDVKDHAYELEAMLLLSSQKSPIRLNFMWHAFMDSNNLLLASPHGNIGSNAIVGDDNIMLCGDFIIF